MLEIVDTLVQFTKSSPVISGLVGVWGLGVSSYLLRNIPTQIWRVVKKQCTTSVTVFNNNTAYFNLLKWLTEQNFASKCRALKITCGRWGETDTPTLSIGYGSHYYLYGWIPMQIELSKVEQHGSSMEQDAMTLTVLGRNTTVFTKLIKELEGKCDKDNITVLKYANECWRPVKQRKRNIDTVFTKKQVKNTILTFVDKFIKNEDWYLEKGLSYQTGILLYGPPGTGKTSFVKALASYLGQSLYVLNVSNLSKIENCIMELPSNSILLIEDIDGDPSTLEREEENKPKPNSDTMAKTLVLSLTNVSDVLNAIDGVITNHGRILIATTNHIEKLDAALLRPGRFDLKIELPYADEEVLQQFFTAYYPNYKMPENVVVKEKISPAHIQNLITCNLDNPDYVLNSCVKEN